MEKKRVLIASVFLLLFGVMQFAELHVLDHDDADDTDCHICQLASEHHNDGYIGTEIIEIPSELKIPVQIVLSHYEQPYFNTEINYSFLNRPPPSA